MWFWFSSPLLQNSFFCVTLNVRAFLNCLHILRPLNVFLLFHRQNGIFASCPPTIHTFQPVHLCFLHQHCLDIQKHKKTSFYKAQLCTTSKHKWGWRVMWSIWCFIQYVWTLRFKEALSQRLSPNVATAPRGKGIVSGKGKRDGLLSTPVVRGSKTMSPRVQALPPW